MAIDQLYHMMGKRVVPIEIIPAKSKDDELVQSGVVIECGSNSAYIITDPRQLEGKTGFNDIVVTFPNGQEVHPSPQHFHMRNDLVGIACYGLSDAKVEKFEICNQPLLMSQKVYLYEAVTRGITKGNISLFDGDHFSNDCAASSYSEYGAPVINKKGELVGICDSTEYETRAKSIRSLLGTIESIRSSFGI